MPILDEIYLSIYKEYVQLNVFLKCRIFTLFPQRITIADIVYSEETSYQLVPSVCWKALTRLNENIFKILTETVLKLLPENVRIEKFRISNERCLWIEILNIQKRVLFVLKFEHIRQTIPNLTRFWHISFSKYWLAVAPGRLYFKDFKFLIRIPTSTYWLKFVIL